MGNKCCSDRNKADGAMPEGGRSSCARKASGDVLNLIPNGSNERPSVLLGIKGKDAEKFDQAFANMDIPAFVELLTSESSLGKGQLEEVPDHPWADRPSCVGSLAATQLAVIASLDEANIVTIRQAGAIEFLTNFLKPSCSQERRSAGVVLLVFLTSADDESSQLLGQRNVLPDLLRILEDKSALRGLRAAISTVLVNVVMEHQGTASRFIRENGGAMLLKACDSTGAKPDEQKFFLEIVENFLELTEAVNFKESMRKAVVASPNILKKLSVQYPKTDIDAIIVQIMEQIV